MLGIQDKLFNPAQQSSLVASRSAVHLFALRSAYGVIIPRENKVYVFILRSQLKVHPTLSPITSFRIIAISFSIPFDEAFPNMSVCCGRFRAGD